MKGEKEGKRRGGVAGARGERDRNQTCRHRVERVDGGVDSCVYARVCVCGFTRYSGDDTSRVERSSAERGIAVQKERPG